MWSNNFIESFNCAIEGFFYVIKTQRNMRIHLVLAVAVFVLGITMDFTRIELVCLASVITMMLFAEMVNTTIEHTVDLISDQIHPLARIIKDVSAGTVLLTAFAAVICGYLLFARHISYSIVGGLSRLKETPLHITIIALLVTLALVMLGKVVFKRGRPLRGGMPSGHAAVSFAIWTMIAFLTSNPLIIVLSFLLALQITRSRLSQGIHTIWEVIAGALLGTTITAIIIQLFK